MLILHLSDIHFHFPVCATKGDPDKPFRTRLLQDARQRAQTLGPVDAVLVGGDIAFAGKPEEYAVALEWLYALAEACRCDPNRIYVIPGNHDVDRDVIVENVSVQNAQLAILGASDMERELARQLRHNETGPSLLKPLAAYSDFASRFSCGLFAPEQMLWTADLPFDGATLRIHGLTSTILSGAGAPAGKNDERRDLYLGPQQTVLDPVDDVVNLVMCHHPPEWLLDGHRAADDICGRASVHLYGHEHRQRIARDPRHVTFFAGAVNPDRRDADWKPGYNIIRLSLGSNATGEVQLDVEAHLLEWQASPEMFRPILDDDCDMHRWVVRLRNIKTTPSAIAARAGTAAAEQRTDPETGMGEERARSIVMRFWNLGASDRREITRELGLVESDEQGLPPAERFGRALLRAAERNMLEALTAAIAEREDI